MTEANTATTDESKSEPLPGSKYANAGTYAKDSNTKILHTTIRPLRLRFMPRQNKLRIVMHTNLE
ncbi:MAG TPA: hypothetical protein IAA33_04610 [Candidatus Helicobacter avicola]|nr:hypothetical protein [Candidatus Helicobacter avicola]